MAKIHFVKCARKDNPVCKRGESYHWWKHNFGVKQYSKERPTRAQATKSSFLSTIYGIEDNVCNMETGEEVVDLALELEEMRDECQCSLDNMPQHFHDVSDSAILLQERIDALDEWISGLDGQDTEAMSVEEIQALVSESNPGIG